MGNDDLLDETETDEAPDVEETSEEAPEEATAETERPSPDLPSPPLPDFVPDAALLQLMGEAVKTRHELESVRAQKTASAKAFGEREKAIDLKLGELLEDIDSRTWHERFVEEEGLCYRTNRLTGETETRPYSPPAQRELPLVQLDPRLAGLSVGLFGEDEGGEHFHIIALAADSVVVEYPDWGTHREGAEEAGDLRCQEEFQADYRRAFEEAREAYCDDVRSAIPFEGCTCQQIVDEADALNPDRVCKALDFLTTFGSVKIETGEDGNPIYFKATPTPKPAGKIQDYLTMEWQTCAAISNAMNLDTKTVGAELRALVEAGVVESEGKTRGKTYRLVAS